jgi:hypothetical protein
MVQFVKISSEMVAAWHSDTCGAGFGLGNNIGRQLVFEVGDFVF